MPLIESESAHFSINCRKFMEAGIDLRSLQNGADEISVSLMNWILSDQALSDEGVLSCTVA